MKHNETIEHATSCLKFQCKKCNYSCSKQSDWNRHIMRLKHTTETKMKHSNVANKNIYECIYCKQSFTSRTTEWRHRKKCSTNQEQNSTNVIINNKNTTGVEIDKDLLIQMLLKNQDVMENVILKNQEVMEKMMKIIPNTGNNSHDLSSK